MPDLDIIYTHYKSQGLVVLSITDDDPVKVNSFISRMGYHPPVLLDTDDKVNKLFHITGIPKTFVFNRQGKLVGEAIDQCTQRQFFELLARTDLKP
jgi:peroxiredoxin